MLKRTVGDELWCISQPDHAAAAGYLAAHWGNDEFARPGQYARCPDPERLRAETVLAIAEHDNGWWEWESDPQIDPADGLPPDLTSLRQSDGLERWRLGVSRFRDDHPYVALLISFHAYCRISLRVSPAGEFRVAIAPYPFDQDPLPVTLRARVLDPAIRHPDSFQTWWQACARREVQFRFVR